MKLYYSPGACSLSPHIVLREIGLDFELEKVDTKTHKTASGADFYAINPKGYVPVLQLDNGEVLTEGAAIVQYLADTNPDAKLAPKAGTLERARLQESLNFIAAELHKSYTPLFKPDTSDEGKDKARTAIHSRLDLIEKQLADGRQHVLGEAFSVADAYLFTVASWSKHVGVDLAKWPKVAAFVARVGQREKVQEALKAEGLVKG